MLLAIVAYPTCVATFSPEDIAQIDSIITAAVAQKMKLQDRYHHDHLHLHPLKNGYGLLSFADLYDAYKLNAIYLALNGPDSPIQRYLKIFERQHAAYEDKITIHGENIWTPILKILKKRGLNLDQSTHIHICSYSSKTPHSPNYSMT
jgi:hypothetical protein